MVVQEFIKYFDDNLLTLGISFTSISPNSEWEYSCFILSLFLSLILIFSSDFVDTNNFISLSVTLPFLSLPETLFISTPNSLANFLAFGDAEVAVEKSFNIKFWVSILFVVSGVFIVISSFTILGSVAFSKLSFISISKILSFSETLSPTFIFSDIIVPSSVEGISTLDLSLSIVISGSFFFNLLTFFNYNRLS